MPSVNHKEDQEIPEDQPEVFETAPQTNGGEKQMEEEIASLKDQLLRALAEAENIRRRAEKNIEEASKYAVTGFAKDLIGVLENLFRAEESIAGENFENQPKVKAFSEGVVMTRREFLKTFDKYGISRIDPLGEKFDPNYHQAVAQIPNAEKSPGTVEQVLQAGYAIKDRLLRPAIVAVTIALPSEEPSTE